MKKWLLIMLITLSGCQAKLKSTTIDKAILSFENNKLEIAPEDYSRDEYDYYKDKIEWIEVEDDVEIIETFKKIIVDSSTGKETVVEDTVTPHTKQSLQELLEYGTAGAHIDINKKGKVEKIVIWGELTIWE